MEKEDLVERGASLLFLYFTVAHIIYHPTNTHAFN